MELTASPSRPPTSSRHLPQISFTSTGDATDLGHLQTMLSRLTSSAIKKLTDASVADNGLLRFPTLSFPSPPPAGTGTRRLCGRCLTLLYHVTCEYGDGTECKYLHVPHCSSMSSLSGASCVICAKTLLLFDGMQKHVSFEPSLRETPLSEWALTWKFDPPATVTWHHYSRQAAGVALMVRHKGGYAWGIGSFVLHPDPCVSLPGVAQRRTVPDYETIAFLDAAESKFGSTLSNESLAIMTSRVQECYSNHTKCHQLFEGTTPGQPVAAWFPDRLIRVTRTEQSGAAKISTRLVLKSDAADYSAAMVQEGIKYVSLSHCWGPAPNPSAPLGGRVGSVLTAETLDAWRRDIPLDKLPLAFQDAVRACVGLGFDHIWIDSLCILQDSVEDWQEQSAVMADVYKFAWLNIAALSTTSDYEGFINDARNPCVVFGFRFPLGLALGGTASDLNARGRPCLLLDGNAKLFWEYQSDLPGGGDWLAPLLTRAWVYQERSLSRRTIAFATHGVFFACDEGSHGEHPDWPAKCGKGGGLRPLLQSRIDISAALAEEVAASRIRTPSAQMQQEAVALMRRFGATWNESVADYTACKLTKSTDRLIAISSIARELANSKILQQKRYLAGLWDINLVYQLAWMSCEGRTTTTARKRVGTEGYVAPSWSWASIEAPVVMAETVWPGQGDSSRALAEVSAADVSLATTFAYGAVTAGWIRIWGCLKPVSASETEKNHDYERGSVSTSLTDAATGAKLWFVSDTTEGYEMVASHAGLSKVVWMPLVLNANSDMVDCKVLVLTEVSRGGGFGGGRFVKPGEKVYRRLGTGNFGTLPSLLRQDKLLMALGRFPGDVTDNLRRFRRIETGYHEFVVI